jgi:hypothetical protein
MATANSWQKDGGRDARQRLASRLRMGFLSREIAQNRYLDVGDWFEGYVGVVPHQDPRSEAAVLVHEIVEYLLCLYAGVSAEDVDRADARILKGQLRKQQSCYWRQHLAALRVERIFCQAMDLDWNDHGKNVNQAFLEQEELVMSGMRKSMGKGNLKVKLKMGKLGKKEKKAVKIK